jgi:hypothetical protein
MSIIAGKRYTGTVTGGRFMESSLNLTPGFQVFIECEDGDADFIIWLTRNNMKGATKSLRVVGADIEQMGNRSYVTNQLPQVVVGKEISFEAKEEEWRGEVKTKVAWIGRVNAASEDEIAANVSKLFANAQAMGAAPLDAGEPPPIDDDIPF